MCLLKSGKSSNGWLLNSVSYQSLNDCSNWYTIWLLFVTTSSSVTPDTVSARNILYAILPNQPAGPDTIPAKVTAALIVSPAVHEPPSSLILDKSKLPNVPYQLSKSPFSRFFINSSERLSI